MCTSGNASTGTRGTMLVAGMQVELLYWIGTKSILRYTVVMTCFTECTQRPKKIDYGKQQRASKTNIFVSKGSPITG